MKKLKLCLDIGGTHISAAVIAMEHNVLTTSNRIRSSVDSMANKETILNHWKHGISKVTVGLASSLYAIYVSIPGPFDYIKGISLMDGMHKYQAILHMDVKTFLSETYQVPLDHIYFFNDAAAFLLGEVYHHQLVGQKVVGLTLGTGLGSALYENNIVQDLNYGSASFRAGIAEDYISTRGMITYINALYQTSIEEVKELVEANKFEKEKYAAFDFLKQSLIDFIGQYITSLNPNYIIIGGSIAKSHHLFITDVQKSIDIPIKIASMDEQNLFYGMISNTETKNNL